MSFSRRRLWSFRPNNVPRRRRTVRLMLEALENRLAPSASGVNVLSSYTALDSNAGGGYEPPDTNGAAGPNSYVETVNQAIAIYNKNTGAPISTDSQRDFYFTQGGLAHVSSFDFQSDSFVAYDPLVDRFITGNLELDGSFKNGGANALLLAVSKTSDLATLTSADWYFYEVDTTQAGVAIQDYPGNVGYNADALVIAQNSFSAAADGTFTDIGTFVNVISIGALTSGATLRPGTNLFQNSYTPQQLPLLPRPVTMTDGQTPHPRATPSDPMWFVASAGEGGQSITGAAHTIDVLEMTNVLSANPTFTTSTLNVNPYYQAVPPLQSIGLEITTNIDSRIMNADEQNGRVVAAQIVSDSAGDEDNARWYEIDVSSGTPQLVQEGDVSGGPGVYDTYPGIAINSQGVIGMSYIQSGTAWGQFMSVYVAGRAPADPAGTMEASVLVKAGQSIYFGSLGGGREGDLSGINVASDGSFWVANEYANRDGLPNWGTVIANFTVTNTPAPTPPTAPQSPASQPPGTLPNPFQRAAADALNLVEDVEGGNAAAAISAWLDFASLYLGSPSSLQPQLLLAFAEDLFADISQALSIFEAGQGPSISVSGPTGNQISQLQA